MLAEGFLCSDVNYTATGPEFPLAWRTFGITNITLIGKDSIQQTQSLCTDYLESDFKSFTAFSLLAKQ